MRNSDSKIVKHIVVTPGTNFVGMLTVAFISLKLANIIDWSWWLVLAPMFIPVIILVVFFVFVLLLDYILRKLGKL